jgi:KipI family sensor histidine kinase inhibitor
MGAACVKLEPPSGDPMGHYNKPAYAQLHEGVKVLTAEVIKRHSERTYRVYMLGFVPGFAYMGRVDPSIAAPRHRVPRERVRAGSVGIAGLQTGVYPVESPGGWQLIGHTTTVMFDPGRDKPSLLAAGDLVRSACERSTPAPLSTLSNPAC